MGGGGGRFILPVVFTSNISGYVAFPGYDGIIVYDVHENCSVDLLLRVGVIFSSMFVCLLLLLLFWGDHQLP